MLQTPLQYKNPSSHCIIVYTEMGRQAYVAPMTSMYMLLCTASRKLCNVLEVGGGKKKHCETNRWKRSDLSDWTTFVNFHVWPSQSTAALLT